MKVKVPETVVDQYTDILSHCYEPGGVRLAAGTTLGKVIVLQRDEEKNEAFKKMETILPASSQAVLGLHWGTAGIFVGSKSLLYLYQPVESKGGSDDADMNEMDVDPLVAKFECMFDVQDVTSLAGVPGTTVFAACDDCCVRAWDVETQKLLVELTDHKMPVEAIRASDEYLVSGGQDGNVIIYDGKLRSNKPVLIFNQRKKMITGVDISPNSTWIAAGSNESPLVYNLKNSATLPQIGIEDPQHIHAVHFASDNTLWWAGSGSVLYKSENLTDLSSDMAATYGNSWMRHIYSIATTKGKRLSIAGSTNGILFSDNSEYWDCMVHV